MKSEIAKKEEFYEWLITQKNLKANSAGDVLSRVKRVNRSVSFSRISHDRALEKLVVSEDYLSASNFVRPQLKRSLKFYFDFLRESKS